MSKRASARAETTYVDPDAVPAIASGVRTVNSAVGVDAIRELHRTNLFYDASTFMLLWASAVGFAILLGSVGLGVVWVLAFVAQGFLFQMLGFFAHDAFLHRKLGGPRWSRIGGALCNAPLTVPFTDYVHSHGAHHRFVNTAKDSERYKQDFDRRWVKLVLLTAAGTKMSWNGRFRQDDQPAWQPSYTPAEARALRFENYGLVVWAALMIGLAIIFPRIIVFGYLLPLLIVSPVASTIRIVLEHADVDVNNPLQNSTMYRTGFVSRLAFLCAAGDCHLVHHLYPRIPFYNMPKALRLLRPVVMEGSQYEHRSVLRLLYLWFVDNRAHGVRWQPDH